MLLQKEVIAQGDSSSLPLSLCFVMAIQCAAWTVYGYVKDDWSTGIHNGVGALLGAIQLSLIWYYPNKRKLAGAVEMSTFSGKSATPTASSSVSAKDEKDKDEDRESKRPSPSASTSSKGELALRIPSVVVSPFYSLTVSIQLNANIPCVTFAAVSAPVALSSGISTSSSSPSLEMADEAGMSSMNGMEEGRHRR